MIDSNSKSENFVNKIYEEIGATPDEGQFIAVDTEFIRENLNKPLLCLIQLATRDAIYVIDPISIDISFLNSIFEDEKIKKVFHSAKQDIEILSLYGIRVKNFYDTQVYEMLLSTKENISYRSIVFKYLQKKIKKNYSMSDWEKRPLKAQQLRYSVNDVLYLRKVYEKQANKLSRLGRLHWLDDELQKFVENEEKNEFYHDSQDEKRLYVFNQLIEWRKKTALEKNTLPEAIVKDDILKTICRRGVNFVHNIKNSRRSTANENLRDFLIFAETIPDLQEMNEIQNDKSAVVDLLKAALEICSKNEQIASSLIATVKDLENLSNGSDAKCLHGWRYEIFGKKARAILGGTAVLCVENLTAVIK
ncbi:MAG: hypothetical protein LBS23_00650 [Holosporaceae bacterium]|nr:hypothetical protein [Holosporaceae bacterium]